MGKSTNALWLLGAMFAWSIGLHFKVEAAAPSSLDINARLKLLNKPAVKTIKSEDGDIIDCVDIYKQPAFDHPALKDHKIQMAPSFIPESKNSKANKSEGVAAKSVISQIWHKSGNCPNGTIPIRRIRRQDLVRVASLKQFGTKPPSRFNLSFIPNVTTDNITMTASDNRSVRNAALLATMGYNYIGAQADINLWNPNVDLPDDFTTAQMWLKAGGGPTFESVEAGWVVNPKLYGDKQSRLFAYWTKDAYKTTGCFDLTCSGFVQTGTQVALGAALGPYSSEQGPQYVVNVGIFWDKSTGNWWLKVGNNIPIGYWPATLFDALSHSAILVEWGGEVFSSELRKAPHTATAMGSGDDASGLYGNAAFIQNLRIMDYSLTLKYPDFVSTVADEPYCYSALNYIKGYGVEPVFYFGGEGRRPPYCP
ncbi:carboxyl-terminal peptidase [Senna tora]|uniref:Carboxyl-terminal peptidase n=1 Tax=Senna tora TaxID=362788 RepID=A0A834TXM8_9FABA|nr:carboxyl-terminal peptidase [Senna tora]